MYSIRMYYHIYIYTYEVILVPSVLPKKIGSTIHPTWGHDQAGFHVLVSLALGV